MFIPRAPAGRWSCLCAGVWIWLWAARKERRGSTYHPGRKESVRLWYWWRINNIYIETTWTKEKTSDFTHRFSVCFGGLWGWAWTRTAENRFWIVSRRQRRGHGPVFLSYLYCFCCCFDALCFQYPGCKFPCVGLIEDYLIFSHV